MQGVKDGPQSPLFRPVQLEGNTRIAHLDLAGVSSQMKSALGHAPDGDCVAWGIPFSVHKVILLQDQAIEWEIPPLHARWLVFMHTADILPPVVSLDQPHPSYRGYGQLGEPCAQYFVRFADGSEVKLPITRRRQIGSFESLWGENCFEAVPHHKPFPLRAAHEQVQKGWGLTQTRISSADSGPWLNWLWAWENPVPQLAISALRFEPGKGAALISAITAADVRLHPLRWETRKKALFVLPDGMKFEPNLDARGLLQQIQLDLGQIISATPKPIYPNEMWGETPANLIPVTSRSEFILEYTAHPEAQFHLSIGDSISLTQIVQPDGLDPLFPIQAADQTVKLRVIDQRSRQMTPVKIHVHGEAGEYLPPLDRHRMINPSWFEDYSVDFLHVDRKRPGDQHPCTYIHGECLLNLPIGKVYIEITKGFEIRPVRKVIDITPGVEEITIEIEKILPWRERGWVTADTHVHFLSPVSALLEGSAEGVNVVNLLASQWGELMTNVGDFDGKTTWGSLEAGGDGEYLVRVGTENRQHVLGHISLLGYRGAMITPMTSGGADEAALGDPVQVLLTEWARQCHQQGGIVILPHFPNPRAEHAASLVSGEIDGIEMTSWDMHDEGIDPYSLVDWYRYLNCGYLVPAVGGTDKMDATTAVGTIRTYARLQPERAFTYEAWLEAIRRKQTFVTYGPLLEFAVGGHPMGSRIALKATGGTLDVSWEVASTTIPMSRVDLVVNGQIAQSTPVAPWQERGHWSVNVQYSSWLALLVRGHYPTKPEVIAAHSTPVMVELDGKTQLAMPDAVTILEQIEGSIAYLDTIGTRAEDRVYKRMRLTLESAYRTLHNRMHQRNVFHEHSPETDHPDRH